MGGQPTIPQYKEPKNSPYITNNQKEVYTGRIAEETFDNNNNNNVSKGMVQNNTNGPIQTIPNNNQFNRTSNSGIPFNKKNTNEPTPYIDFKIYPQPNTTTQPKRNQPLPENVGTMIPISVPTPMFPPQYAYQYANGQHPLMQQVNPVTVVKSYTINTTGPTGDHAKLNMLFEDALPKQFSGTPNTIAERLLMIHYIRSIMFSQGNGKDISIDGSGPESLISHLKFMDLNPYNTYKFSNNPYRGLPTDMLLYRSCYPVRYNSGSVSCARDAIGMNVRIYKLTQGEFMINKQNQKNYLDYENWREIAYYEFISKTFITPKTCPHFVSMYGYHLVEKSNIDFTKISQLKGIQNNEEIYQNDNEYIPIEGNYIGPIPQNISNNNQINNLKGNLKGGNKTLIINQDAYTGKALVILTESPNYNLLGWSSRVYQKEGNVGRMINTGFHAENVWMSILFQLMAALCCLQYNNLWYENFSIENNVFIKDLSITNNATAYWKYIINGIEYYIPNYGYLVLLDSSFKDLEKDTNLIIKNDKKIHKIMCTEFVSPNDPIVEKSICLNKTFEMFKNAINPNIFDKSFITNGGCRPSPKIMELITKIYADANKTPYIVYYIQKYMMQFLHNRIGTVLREQEIASIRKSGYILDDLNIGDILVYEKSNDVYQFVLLIEINNNNNNNVIPSILTKDNDNDEEFISKPVALTSLFAYSKNEPILQSFKANEGGKDELLETYTINNK